MAADIEPIPYLLVLDRDERIVYANDAAAQVWGIPAARLVGKSIADIVGGDTRQALRPHTTRALAGETVSREWVFRDAGGRRRVYLHTFLPDRDPDGTIRGFIATGVDITDRYRGETFERERLAAIFAASPAAMALWRGRDAVFEMVNPAFQAIFHDRQLIGKPFLEALPEFEGQPFAALILRVLETGEPHVGREMLARHRTTPNGPIEDHYYDFTYARIEVAGQPYGVYDHSVDVTARVHERQLRERFVATLTHDLRTPLTVAKLSAHLLARHRDPDSIVRFVGRLSESLDRIDAMVRDLLDANRLSAGERLPVHVSAANLTEALRQVVDQEIGVHGHRFLVDADQDVYGWWDVAALRRVFENLLSNAVKYGDPQRPIRVTLRRRGDQACISVHNWGEPIPAKEQPQLFQPYRRSAGAHSSGQAGWGLGLTVVRGVVEAHGGSVSVDSSAERGTFFTVHLPLGGRRHADITDGQDDESLGASKE